MPCRKPSPVLDFPPSTGHCEHCTSGHIRNGKSHSDPRRSDCGRRRRPARPLLGPSLLPDAGRPAEAGPARPLRAGRASRRHRRALVFVDDQCRQRSSDRARTKVSATSTFDGTEGAPARRRSRRLGDEFLGADVMEQQGGWNLLCKFFDNLGPIPHHMHQNDEFAARVGQKGQARSLLLSAAVQLQGQQFPVHLHGPRARAPPGTTSAAAWSAGTKAITASCTTRRPTS